MSRFMVLAYLAVLVSTGCGPGEEGLPRQSEVTALYADPEVVDLGDVPIHGKYELHTRIVNRGAAAVTIKDVRPTCGCTAVKLGKMSLAPGEATTLSGVYQVGSSPGLGAKQIAIVPKSGKSILVRVEANRIRAMHSQAELLALCPDLVANRSDVGRFVVSNQSGDPVTLAAPVNSVGGLAIKVDSLEIPPDGEANIMVTAASDLIRSRTVMVKLQTTHSRESHLELPIETRPKYNIDVEPEAIHLGVVSRSALLSGNEIHLKCEGTALEHLSFTGVRTVAHLELLDYEMVLPQSAALRFVTIDKFSGGDLSGVLEIRFRHSRMPVSVEIPITGFLTDGN